MSFAPFFLARITHDQFHHDAIRTEARRSSRTRRAEVAACGSP